MEYAGTGILRYEKCSLRLVLELQKKIRKKRELFNTEKNNNTEFVEKL